jgi:hypothetical protein
MASLDAQTYADFEVGRRRRIHGRHRGAAGGVGRRDSRVQVLHAAGIVPALETAWRPPLAS